MWLLLQMSFEKFFCKPLNVFYNLIQISVLLNLYLKGIGLVFTIFFFAFPRVAEITQTTIIAQANRGSRKIGPQTCCWEKREVLTICRKN